MKLIFDWSNSFYEEKTVWRGDEEMISLEISQKECSFASAKVLIASKCTEKLLRKKYAKIGIRLEPTAAVRLLFAGRLVAFPLGLSSSSVELELIAEPDDYQLQLKQFSSQHMADHGKIDGHLLKNQRILFDDLFFSERDMSNPTIFLEGDSNLFYWDMRSGKLSLSHINRGVKNIDVTGSEILQNSLKVRLAREPYGRINLSLSVSWIQQAAGIIDVYPMIAQKFSCGMVNSFTNIKSSVENIFKISHKNGYAPLRCRVREINPNVMGILKVHPLLSQDFYVKKEGEPSAKKVNFKRFYFDGELTLGWNYRQKRTEIARVHVINGKSQSGREKNLFLRLNAVQNPRQHPTWNYFTYYGCSNRVQHRGNIFECLEAHVSDREFEKKNWKLIKKIPDALADDFCGSFFATNRGKNALRYAIQKAAALLNYSSRYVEIDFCVGAKNFMFATVDDQITLRDVRFSGDKISGKIIRAQFLGSADQKIMKITIGCRADGSGEDYFEKILSYDPAIGEDDSKVHPGDIVTEIEVKNSPEEQMERLAQLKAQDVSELKSELKKHATRIKISLHPINTMRVITREIDLPDVVL
ncbi:MAG: hypothetical protein LBT63_03480 [Holosporaceae bacterium]|jgi:hypothetical protein|nr:hypothetical protein [Holosporaceae bacterium]